MTRIISFVTALNVLIRSIAVTVCHNVAMDQMSSIATTLFLVHNSSVKTSVAYQKIGSVMASLIVQMMDPIDPMKKVVTEHIVTLEVDVNFYATNSRRIYVCLYRKNVMVMTIVVMAAMKKVAIAHVLATCLLVNEFANVFLFNKFVMVNRNVEINPTKKIANATQVNILVKVASVLMQQNYVMDSWIARKATMKVIQIAEVSLIFKNSSDS